MSPSRAPLSERMADAARELEGGHDPQTTMDAAVRLAASNVRGCDAAAISLVHKRRRIDTPAYTDDSAMHSDKLQYDAGEGPCLDAVWEQRVTHSADLRADERWPTWGPRVADEVGFASILCFQLFTHEDTVGAVNLYSRTLNGFDEQDMDDGLALSAHISVAVAGAQQIEHLTEALDTRTLIGQAVGIVMERYSVDADRAFQVLSRISSHSNVRVRDLAEEIVSTRRIPGTAQG